jgi:TPR repeat protein
MNGTVQGMALALLLAAHLPASGGDLYSEGVDAALAGDYRTASDKWTQVIAGTDGRAMFQLALLYHAGLYVERSETMAVQLYTSAAEKGVPEAQEYLAAGYANGWFGLSKNDALAGYWLARLESSQASQQVAQAARPSRPRPIDPG